MRVPYDRDESVAAPALEILHGDVGRVARDRDAVIIVRDRRLADIDIPALDVEAVRVAFPSRVDCDVGEGGAVEAVRADDEARGVAQSDVVHGEAGEVAASDDARAARVPGIGTSSHELSNASATQTKPRMRALGRTTRAPCAPRRPTTAGPARRSRPHL